ncbi:MAG: AmpG family muropeptide MFS transporter [Stellaceae bacterium]|jgi:MFS transporter, PAT family, beta-lactamase induction signal transducer AmpG
MIASWLAALRVYADRRMLAILLMGFSSGLPLALTGATLAIWLKESGVTLTSIGLFAQVGLAYNLKFLWSPAMDRVRVPLLTGILGRRRSWAVTVQAALALALLAMALCDPAINLGRVVLAAAVVAFLSASQDIVIDAYRIELLGEREQGAGAAATQVGYRVGMIASGAGALYLASYFGWFWSYAGMSALMLVGIATVLMTREPKAVKAPKEKNWFERSVAAPFAEFASRRGWVLILVFVVLYKFGDALAGIMSNPFYIALGFSKIEIANVAKLFGAGASVAGIFLGGLLVYRLGLMRALLACGALQMLSNLMYILQYWAGPDPSVLAMTIAAENVTGGMASAAFVAYLSRLCNPAFTATQYALLSALAATARTVLASGGGFLADRLGWTAFFAASTLACLPALGLLLYLMRSAEAQQPRPVAAQPRPPVGKARR